jgi:Zn-dependent protease
LSDDVGPREPNPPAGPEPAPDPRVTRGVSSPDHPPMTGLRVGRLLGVPVYVAASWFLLAAVLIFWYAPYAQRTIEGLSSLGAYLVAAAFAACLLLSVLLHELGHAAVARVYKIHVRAIKLELLGGYTELEGESPSARADLAVSLAGPAVSALLGVGAAGLYVVLPAGTLLEQLAFQLAFSNILVAIFNSLPGMPLDGGRALRAAVWGITGDRHLGSRVAGWIGRGVAILTVAGSFYLSYTGGLSVVSVFFALLIGLTLWQGATAAIRHGRLAARLPMVNLRQLARPVFAVPYGTPLSEATRRAGEAGQADATVGVTDGTGRLVAVVMDQAAKAVPHERRPWVAVESVARTLDPDRTLAADLTGEDVIRAVQAHPAPSYLVVAGDDVVGVLRLDDLARLLNS